MSEHAKPTAMLDEDSGPFYAAAKAHKLSLQKCTSCRAFRFPAAPVCPECTAIGADWEEVSGRGKVFSFVVYHRAYDKGFEQQVPYTVALIELAEGPRMISNVIGISPDQVRCDMPVTVVFEDVTPEYTLPKFKPLS